MSLSQADLKAAILSFISSVSSANGSITADQAADQLATAIDSHIKRAVVTIPIGQVSIASAPGTNIVPAVGGLS